MSGYIYLDAAASTKPDSKVIDAMMPYLNVKWHNPSSLYSKSVSIKKDIENARAIISDFIGASGNEIFFTSGGSESNCWAIQGFVNDCHMRNYRPLIITSSIEHKSIIECVHNSTANSVFISVDKEGFVNIEELERWLVWAKDVNFKTLVSIQMANNEIGTTQNIKMIADITHKYGALLHTDAVQAFGQLYIDVQDFGIDMLSASGHKIGAPKGIGILYKKNGVNITPLIYGSQMDGMRGGTENVPYIMGMAKAVQLIQRDDDYQLRLTVLRNNFIAKLKSLGCKINGDSNMRLPNNISVTFSQDITGESLLYILDMCDIQISTGSACNSHSIESSYVLKAIGLTDEDARKTIRITLPHDITMDEIDESIVEIEKAIKIIEA